MASAAAFSSTMLTVGFDTKVSKSRRTSRNSVLVTSLDKKKNGTEKKKRRKVCEVCDNSRMTPCYKCRMRGEAKTPYLPFSIDPVKKPCPACQGRGWFPCPDCLPPPSRDEYV